MSTQKPPGSAVDPSASDILSPQFWVGKAERQAPGVDVACTKIAVDLQNMRPESADDSIRRSLETLREATSDDAAFAIFLDQNARHIESVVCARGHFAQCHPEA